MSSLRRPSWTNSWYPRQDSHLDFRFRKPVSCLLNDGGMLGFFKGKPIARMEARVGFEPTFRQFNKLLLSH